MSREFSKVYRNIWKSKKFKRLRDNDDARLCYFYLLTCPEANSAGCYDLEEGYAIADLGWSPERYRKAIGALCDTSLIEIDEGDDTILITNWTKFNEPTNGKHALGIFTALDQASSDALKAKRIQEFGDIVRRKSFDKDRSVGEQIKAYLDWAEKAIETVSSVRLETESQTEIESKIERVESLPPTPNPQPAPVDIGDRPPLRDGGGKISSRFLKWAIEGPLWTAAGASLDQVSPNLHQLSDLVAWIEGGADFDLDILPAIEAKAAAVRPGMVKSWGFFAQAVVNAKAKRTATLPEPTDAWDSNDRQPVRGVFDLEELRAGAKQ